VTDRIPTHRCKVCGCKWIFWPAGTPGGGTDQAWWSLGTNEKCGPCCDNVAMGDQIETMPPNAWVVIGPDGNAEYVASWPEACHEHINEMLMNGCDEEAAQYRVREYTPA
jgi:hypothetical protein